MHVTLRAGELGGIFHFDQDDEVQIVPHVVLGFNVLFEADGFVVERRTIEAANEAGIFQYELFLLLFATQVGERVDDHTENQVQDDNDDDEEEQQVVYHTGDKQSLLQFAI